MIESLRILCAAGLTIGSCFAAGKTLLKRCAPGLTRAEENLLAFVPGAACLSPVFFLLALCGATHPAVFALVQLAAIALAFRVRRTAEPAGTRRLLPQHPLWRIAFPAIFAVFAVLYVSHAVGSGVVLAGGPRLESLVRLLHGGEAGRWATGVENGLPQGVDVVFLPALALGGRTAMGLVRVAFLLLLPWLMLAWARRSGIEAAGVFGAVFAFVSPAMGFAGSSAFDGAAMAAILFTLFYLLEMDASAVLIGLTAGFACSAGYSGFLALPYLGCVLAWRRRWRAAGIALALAVLIASPWLVRNQVVIGNPVSPFFTRLFPNPHVTVQGERDFVRRTAVYPEVKSPLEVPLQVTILGGTLGPAAGPLFLLAPFALLALRSPVGRKLLFAAVVLGAAYPLNYGTRYLTPVLPYLSLAMGLAFANSRVLAPALILLHVVLSLPMAADRYSEPGTQRIKGAVLSPLIRLSSPPADPVTVLLNRVGRDRIFALSPVPRTDRLRDLLVAGDSAQSDVLAEILRTPILPANKPVFQRTFRFDARRVSALRVIAAGAARAEWRVAELRIYRNGAELPRLPRWRLSAAPNPWDVQLAFDNTPVTGWATRQDVEPGMRIEVDFGGAVDVDRVVIESSRGQGAIPLEVHGLADRGGWTKIADRTEDIEVAPPFALRRAAIREFRARGIGYIVAADSDFPAPDFAERPALWGIEEVGRAGAYRLHRVLPPADKESRP